MGTASKRIWSDLKDCAARITPTVVRHDPPATVSGEGRSVEVGVCVPIPRQATDVPMALETTTWQDPRRAVHPHSETLCPLVGAVSPRPLTREKKTPFQPMIGRRPL